MSPRRQAIFSIFTEDIGLEVMLNRQTNHETWKGSDGSSEPQIVEPLRISDAKTHRRANELRDEHSDRQGTNWLKIAPAVYDLSYIDLEQKTLQPLDNPFGTRLSPMS
jgi:hypothetical protein